MSIKILAYYLPQYHPIPENDKWWGKGFTEWTNVKKAKPLFKGHKQPIYPGELGYYDLRNPEIQENQAKLANEYGVDGFIYYQYWFDTDKMLLEKPAEAMLKNKKVDIPFCFCWANETWKGIWHGMDNDSILIEQKYNGANGYKKYFQYLLPFFKDERYIKIDNKPMFHIYRIQDIPDLNTFLKTFNDLALQNGFKGIYLVATGNEKNEIIKFNKDINAVVGLDSFTKMRYGSHFYFNSNNLLGKIERSIKHRLKSLDTTPIEKRTKPIKINYKKEIYRLKPEFKTAKYVPCIFPNWDNSARSQNKSLIFFNSNPTHWKNHFYDVVKNYLRHKENPPFIVIKSWNEWAEGNYIEPDAKYGRGWLEAVSTVKKELDLN